MVAENEDFDNESQNFLSRPYHFNFFKGCLPQILPGPFMNSLSHMSIAVVRNNSPVLITRHA